MDEDLIRAGLRDFKGVKRRFTKTGICNGIIVIDDYGHHPVEIQAALNAARLACDSGKVIVVFQPHRYTRLRDLFDEFCDCFEEADIVFVSDVFAAGELPIDNFDKDHLTEGIRRRNYCQVLPLKNEQELPSQIAAVAEPGDLVICLGAGNITNWANSLPKNLEEVFKAIGGHAIPKPKELGNSKSTNWKNDTRKSDAAIAKM